MARPLRFYLLMPFAFIFVLVVWEAVQGYPLWRILAWAFPQHELILLIPGLLIPFAPPLLRLLDEVVGHPITRLFAQLGWFLFGFLFIALWVCIVFEIVFAAWPAFHENFSYVGSITVTGVGVLLCLIAFINAHQIRIVEHTIRTSKVRRPVRLVQLSDIHIGSRSPSFLKRVVDRVNLLNPDLVVVTGDFTDARGVGPRGDIDGFNEIRCRGTPTHTPPLEKNSPAPEESAPPKEQEASVYAVFGNHDFMSGAGPLGDSCHSRLPKFSLLRDQVVRVRIPSPAASPAHVPSPDPGVVLQLVGLDDRNRGADMVRAYRGLRNLLDDDLYTVLLYHRPHGVEQVGALGGIDLFLAGHTHAGQIFPFSLLVKIMFPYAAGLFHVKAPVPATTTAVGPASTETTPINPSKQLLYTSQGTGTWGPLLRLGTRNEITLFNIVPA
ncbi:putative integral membrane protein [Paratrimastix pyriformis]|uniref:Integral membrane protein n=1 Tax=Paratrimastix pyriformis TaxID=342808 RepID=A0ABQ8UE34_9EUKA|nr:putative integral membrane protein [Paratrimastix pyriformis]